MAIYDNLECSPLFWGHLNCSFGGLLILPARFALTDFAVFCLR